MPGSLELLLDELLELELLEEELLLELELSRIAPVCA